MAMTGLEQLIAAADYVEKAEKIELLRRMGMDGSFNLSSGGSGSGGDSSGSSSNTNSPPASPTSAGTISNATTTAHYVRLSTTAAASAASGSGGSGVRAGPAATASKATANGEYQYILYTRIFPDTHARPSCPVFHTVPEYRKTLLHIFRQP